MTYGGTSSNAATHDAKKNTAATKLLHTHKHTQQSGFMDTDSELQNNVGATTEEGADTG